MHLTSLVLRGFKSFPSATTIRFEPGINCIVGPNGSGKSNIVDALSWVMGEQGAKNLRGGHMADVIFAGSASRSALGRAEVSLTIDNADGVLPIEFGEVTISRTLFREGGSEYAINGTPCRLLDIQELLSDTGMGREMHVIIGQGKLDEVLTSTPEDRRSFIEEAAGVLKHRKRKEKAARKLEAMAGNLTRLEDLTGEIRRQLGPLARQAETARRASIIQTEVRDARLRVLADDLAQAQARMESHTLDGAALVKRQEEIEGRLAQAREALQDAENRQAQIDPHVRTLIDRTTRLESLAERYRSLSQLASERARSLSQPINRENPRRPAELRERAEEAAAAEKDVRAELDAVVSLSQKATAEREAAESHERELSTRLTALNRALADHREDEARRRGTIATSQTKIDTLLAEAERVKAALAGAEERYERSQAECATLEAALVADNDTAELSDKAQAAGEAASAAARAAANAREDLTAAKAELAKWEATASTLDAALALDDSGEWVAAHYPSARALLDTLRVDSGWETAIEALLSTEADAMIVESLAAGIDVLRAAGDDGVGSVRLVWPAGSAAGAKDAGSSAAGSSAARAKASRGDTPAGTGTWALDVVTIESGYAVLIEPLLEGAVLVDDLVSARRVIDAGAVVAVTAAGHVVRRQSAVMESRAATRLARLGARDEAVAQAEAARIAVDTLSAAVTEADERAAKAVADAEAVTAELRAIDAKMGATAAQLGVLRQSVAASQADIERSRQRLTAIENEVSVQQATHQALVEYTPETDAAELEDQLRATTSAFDEAHHATVAARAAETEIKLKVRSREERLRSLAGTADNLFAQADAAQARIDREARLIAHREEGARKAEAVAMAATNAGHLAARLAVEARTEWNTATAAREQLTGEIRACTARVSSIREELAELTNESHRKELARTEARLEWERLAGVALEDMGIEPEVLVEEYGPHQMITGPDGEEYPFVREDQEKRLRKAERDLARLGAINPLALEEHAALEERHAYLSRQLADLRQSRDDLLSLISDIDSHITTIMGEAIADVSREFTQMFDRLFPGGHGEIIVSDPANPLTTGIDIEARPPGKKVKRLSLLSGGERSLTALAFLLAIFSARPSPFYVLDEVEAALDDTNLSRLLTVLHAIREKSQLLIITHQKRTMEIADVLYGISMRDKGISTVITQKMSAFQG